MNDLVLSKAANRPGEVRLIRIPDSVYQGWYETVADTDPLYREHIKRVIFKHLEGYLKNCYPGYGIIDVQDFSWTDALNLNDGIELIEMDCPITRLKFKHKLPREFQFNWGMYVLIGWNLDTTLMSDEELRKYLEETT